MWTWIMILLALAPLLYIFFLKRELRKLKEEIRGIPIRAAFGSRLSLDFREKELLDLVGELNQMIDAFEGRNRQSKRMEENVRLTIAGLSHDLRTPLTSINGYVQLLSTTADEEKRAGYLKVIEHSVKRLLEMNDHFYDLASIEINQRELQLSPISLPQLVEETFLSFYEQFEEKKIDLQFPEQVHDRKIIGDKLMLTRVIQNLIQNILRYANHQAEIIYTEDENHLILSVGNDIKPHSKLAIEKVFTRFYTEDTSRTNIESSGIGLYLSKKLVEKMNGKMDAKLEDNWFVLSIHFPINGHRIH